MSSVADLLGDHYRRKRGPEFVTDRQRADHMSSKDIEIGRRDRITGRQRDLELAGRVLRMDLPDVHA